MMRVASVIVAVVGAALLVAASSVLAAPASAAPSAAAIRAAPDPNAILAQAKAVTGGKAWDDLRTQHSVVKLTANGEAGTAERWASLLTGRSRMRFELGRTHAVLGFDGLVAWSADSAGRVSLENDPVTAQLAVNAAYRDRLAFWYPERQGAKIDYVRRDSADGNTYDVLLIVPDAGRPYELWVNTVTHRIERLREGEATAIRTEVYSDFRAVQGVTVPFTVLAWRGERDPLHEERYVVERIEYNVSLEGIEFTPPTR